MPFIMVSLIFTDFTPLDGLENEWYTEDAWALTNVWKKRFLNLTFTALHTICSCHSFCEEQCGVTST
jgi:hypothetical protein